MNTHAPLPADANATPADPAQGADLAARRARHLDMLDRLAELGMALAEEIGRQVAQGPPPEPQAAAGAGAAAAAGRARPAQFHSDLAQAFHRASRAVRMTIALHEQMTAPPRGKAAPAGASGDEPAPLTLEDIIFRIEDERLLKARVEKAVETAARAVDGDEAAVQRLVREGRERLDDQETFPDMLAVPPEQVIARICRDLGLAPPGEMSPGEMSPGAAPPPPSSVPPYADEGYDDYPAINSDWPAGPPSYRGGGP